ncbi:hypothetical protein FQR65_LT08267 [Abscondita terminalis]|nr:hypothetical protein FQR65_LT08267 [Abscondita terminalis]
MCRNKTVLEIIERHPTDGSKMDHRVGVTLAEGFFAPLDTEFAQFLILIDTFIALQGLQNKNGTVRDHNIIFPPSYTRGRQGDQVCLDTWSRTECKYLHIT